MEGRELVHVFLRCHDCLTSSKATSCNGIVRGHPSKGAISSKRADIVVSAHLLLGFYPTNFNHLIFIAI